VANYGTVPGFKVYVDARGGSYAGKSDEQITQALVRATAYIDGAYRTSFPGVKTDGRAQELEWPRSGAVDREGLAIASDEIPAEIESATYEGATRELASPGALAPDIEAGGGQLTREKIGPLEFEYARNGLQTATFQGIEQALSGLVNIPSPYSASAVRA
jgi:hypothetical protein